MNAPAPGGFGGMMQAGMGGSGAGVQKRNPTQALLPVFALAGGVVLNIIISFISPSLGYLMYLIGMVAYIVLSGMLLNKMAEELKGVTGDQEIAGWMMWIPTVSNIMCMIKVHPLMERARQQRGIQTPAKPNWMYFILPWYAFASDLNDLA